MFEKNVIIDDDRNNFIALNVSALKNFYSLTTEQGRMLMNLFIDRDKKLSYELRCGAIIANTIERLCTQFGKSRQGARNALYALIQKNIFIQLEDNIYLINPYYFSKWKIDDTQAELKKYCEIYETPWAYHAIFEDGIKRGHRYLAFYRDTVEYMCDLRKTSRNVLLYFANKVKQNHVHTQKGIECVPFSEYKQKILKDLKIQKPGLMKSLDELLSLRFIYMPEDGLIAINPYLIGCSTPVANQKQRKLYDEYRTWNESTVFA